METSWASSLIGSLAPVATSLTAKMRLCEGKHLVFCQEVYKVPRLRPQYADQYSKYFLQGLPQSDSRLPASKRVTDRETFADLLATIY